MILPRVTDLAVRRQPSRGRVPSCHGDHRHEETRTPDLYSVNCGLENSAARRGLGTRNLRVLTALQIEPSTAGKQTARFAPNRFRMVSPTLSSGFGQETTVEKKPREFAHLTQPKVQFPKVLRRTATSIVLLTVFLVGITPPGVCALMCERHARTESPRHCGQPSDSMSGMAHDHSAMNHPGIEAMKAVLASQSCQTNCVTAERLNVWRKVVPQVTVVRSSVVVLGAPAEFLAPDFTAAGGLDSGPPAPPLAHAASFSILRI